MINRASVTELKQIKTALNFIFGRHKLSFFLIRFVGCKTSANIF